MRLTLTALAAIIVAGPAAAEITGEYHRYTIDGTEFEGYVATNTGLEEPRGTVVIVHDWDGMTEYEERRAEMLAALGYTAFAIDVYGAETDPQGMEDYQRLSGEMYSDRETFRTRLLGSLEEAANIPGAGGDIVMMGYCFGGAAVLEAARAGADVAAFVSFHGGLGTPEGQDYSSTTAPIHFFHGTADPVSGPADLAQVLSELEEAGVDHEAQIFGGARHAFTVWGGRDYLLEADEASWSGLQEVLETRL